MMFYFLDLKFFNFVCSVSKLKSFFVPFLVCLFYFLHYFSTNESIYKILLKVSTLSEVMNRLFLF